MDKFFVIIIDEDGEMLDARDHRWAATAIEDATEYAGLYPTACVGVFKGRENIAQYFPNPREWWTKIAGKWAKGVINYDINGGRGDFIQLGGESKLVKDTA